MDLHSSIDYRLDPVHNTLPPNPEPLVLARHSHERTRCHGESHNRRTCRPDFSPPRPSGTRPRNWPKILSYPGVLCSGSFWQRQVDHFTTVTGPSKQLLLHDAPPQEVVRADGHVFRPHVLRTVHLVVLAGRGAESRSHGGNTIVGRVEGV